MLDLFVVGAVAEQLVRLAEVSLLAVAADWECRTLPSETWWPVLLAIEKNEATSAAVATALFTRRNF